MQQREKICKGCSQPKRLFSHGLCQWCWGREYAGKQKIKGQKQPIARKPITKKKRKVTGEYALFLALVSRNPNPVCYVTGKPVNVWMDSKTLDVRCFSHVLAKGPYPRFRLYEKNITIVLPWVHSKWEARTTDMRSIEMWKGKFELHDELKREYNQK